MNIFQSLLRLTAILMKVETLKQQYKMLGDSPSPEGALDFTINARDFFRDIDELRK